MPYPPVLAFALVLVWEVFIILTTYVSLRWTVERLREVSVGSWTAKDWARAVGQAIFVVLMTLGFIFWFLPSCSANPTTCGP